MGFISDSFNGNCAIDVYKWNVKGSNSLIMNEDPWSGLMIDF